jgi:phosphomethylpyrimidine synthase
MNKITRTSELAAPLVTTGPLPASSKVYTAPEGHADVRVPLREIALSGGEPPFRVYDPSGPYTDATAEIDVARGLPRLREAWVRARAVETYDGRAVRPEDNGNVSASHLARDFPNKPRPFRATSTSPPSPLRGEGRGGGGAPPSMSWTPPTPNHPHQGGGGPGVAQRGVYPHTQQQ